VSRPLSRRLSWLPATKILLSRRRRENHGEAENKPQKNCGQAAEKITATSANREKFVIIGVCEQ